MKIHLKRVNDSVRFEATNARGHSILIEGSRNIGVKTWVPPQRNYWS
jgi:hypothetical protein